MEPSYVYLKITFPQDLPTNYRTFRFHRNHSVNYVIKELDSLVREWAEEQHRKDSNNNNNNNNYANYFKNPKAKISDLSVRTPCSSESSTTQFTAVSFDESAIMERESYISSDALYVSHFGLFVPEFHAWLRESASLRDYPNLDSVEFVEYKPKDRAMSLNGHESMSRARSLKSFTNPIRKKLFWSPEHLWNGCHRFPNTKKTKNPFNTFVYNPPNNNGIAHGLLVDNPLFSDILIGFPTVPTIKPIPAHFVILLTRCPSFLPKNDVQIDQVDITHPMLTDRATIIRLLLYIYGGDPRFSTCTAEMTMRLYFAGSLYKIPRLMHKSLQYLPKKLTMDTVVSCIHLAEKMESPELKDCCVQYCVENYASFVMDKERTKSLGIEIFQHIVALKANRNDTEEVISSHKDCPRGTLVADYKRLFDSQFLADIEIFVDNQKFQCHRSIIAIHSNYLAKLCLEAIQTFQKKELRSLSRRKLKKRLELPCIEITDVTAPVFQAILKFIYYYDTTFSTAVACDILKVCRRFELHTLRSYCEDYLENSPISHDTVFTLYSLHSWYSGSYFRQQFAARMKTKASHFMAKHFTSLDLRKVLQLDSQAAMEALHLIQKLNKTKSESEKGHSGAPKDVSESESSLQSKHKLKQWQFKHIDSDITDAESIVSSERSELNVPTESVAQNGPQIVYPSSFPFQRRFDSVGSHAVVLPQEIQMKEKRRPMAVFEVDFGQNQTQAHPTTEPLPDSRDHACGMQRDFAQISEDDIRIAESKTSSEESTILNETHSRISPNKFIVHKPLVHLDSETILRDKNVVSAAMSEIENIIDSLSSIITDVQTANNSSF